MDLDLEKLKALLRLLEKRNVTEFEFEDEHVRMRLARGGSSERSTMYEERASLVVSSTATTNAPEAAAPAEMDVLFVTSPFVGTFYRSPSPDKPPFVEIGSMIVAGQALCIVEAMKLMNEIEAETSGVIVEILAENGKPVEFGQKLFKVKKL